MAEACSGLDVQLVLAVGGTEGSPLPELPGIHIVVNYAPQVELLKRAALTITHAGMNTTVQALHFGLPLIAVPLTHDQPAIAARLNRTGAGIVISAKKLTVRAMRKAICLVLDDEESVRTGGTFPQGLPSGLATASWLLCFSMTCKQQKGSSHQHFTQELLQDPES